MLLYMLAVWMMSLYTCYVINITAREELLWSAGSAPAGQ